MLASGLMIALVFVGLAILAVQYAPAEAQNLPICQGPPGSVNPSTIWTPTSGFCVPPMAATSSSSGVTGTGTGTAGTGTSASGSNVINPKGNPSACAALSGSDLQSSVSISGTNGTKANSNYYATAVGAQLLADCLGLDPSSVSSIWSGVGGSCQPSSPYSTPDQLAVKLPNGTLVNAGYLIDRIVNGGLDPQSLASQVAQNAAPGSLAQNGPASSCGCPAGTSYNSAYGTCSGAGPTYAGTGSGSTASGNGGTSFGGVSVGAPGTAGRGTGVSITNTQGALSLAAQNWQQALSQVSAGQPTPPAKPASGSPAPGSSQSSGASATGGACASASALLASSMSTLQGVANIISSNTISPQIVSSVQNLISAVAQVLGALASCSG